MTILLIDFESQSPCPIGRGVDNYASHPETDILCMSYGLMGDKPKLWTRGEPVPQAVNDYVEAGGLIGASNAAFDSAIWDYIAVEEYGFAPAKLEQWFCTQVQSRVAGLPSSLDKSARAIKSRKRKNSSGRALIMKCCIPPYSTDPQDYIDLGDYCLDDWWTMDEVCRSIPMLMQHNLTDYHVNERINLRGIKIDRQLAQAAQQYAEQERDEINEKIEYITDGALTKHTQYQRFTKWLRDCLEDDECEDAVTLMTRYKTCKKTKETIKKYSSDKNVRASLLADPESLNLSWDIIEALQFMDDASGSAVSKFSKMLKIASDDDRVRGALRYAGAPSTLRYSSMGLQLHNFRRDAFTPEEAEHFKKQMLAGKPLSDPETGETLRIIDTLGRLLRSAIIPEPGHVLVVNDWNAVESRMTAYLAGDTAKLDMFNSGECPYCYAAEGIYGRPINKEDDPKERQVGKTVDLACGFLGGVGALAAMAGSLGVHIPEDTRQGIVDSWRARHPKVVQLGDRLLAAAHNAMKHQGRWVNGGPAQYFFDGSALFVKLPDGVTLLRYPEARIEMQPVPWDENDLRPQITALKAAFTPAADAEEWARHGLWRGLLLENVVQAICAVMLRECVAKMDNVIFHVHDEIVLEVPKKQAKKAAKRLQKVMETSPTWASDLPLVAKPEIVTRYGK